MLYQTNAAKKQNEKYNTQEIHKRKGNQRNPPTKLLTHTKQINTNRYEQHSKQINQHKTNKQQ